MRSFNTLTKHVQNELSFREIIEHLLKIFWLINLLPKKFCQKLQITWLFFIFFSLINIYKEIIRLRFPFCIKSNGLKHFYFFGCIFSSSLWMAKWSPLDVPRCFSNSDIHRVYIKQDIYVKILKAVLIFSI